MTSGTGSDGARLVMVSPRLAESCAVGNAFMFQVLLDMIVPAYCSHFELQKIEKGGGVFDHAIGSESCIPAFYY